MACLNMFNSEQRGLCTSTMGPRISFSNDFGDTQQAITKHQSNYKEAPVSSDFEFTVTNNSKLSTTADEIFSKGVLLPCKDSFADKSRKMTLRDELLADDDEVEDVSSPRLPKGYSGRWIAKLGLKRSHVTKKCDKSYGGLERVVEEKSPVLDLEDGLVNKKAQELLNHGEPIEFWRLKDNGVGEDLTR